MRSRAAYAAGRLQHSGWAAALLLPGAAEREAAGRARCRCWRAVFKVGAAGEPRSSGLLRPGAPRPTAPPRFLASGPPLASAASGAPKDELRSGARRGSEGQHSARGRRIAMSFARRGSEGQHSARGRRIAMSSSGQHSAQSSLRSARVGRPCPGKSPAATSAEPRLGAGFYFHGRRPQLNTAHTAQRPQPLAKDLKTGRRAVNEAAAGGKPLGQLSAGVL
jgi:hypothetical protein